MSAISGVLCEWSLQVGEPVPDLAVGVTAGSVWAVKEGSIPGQALWTVFSLSVFSLSPLLLLGESVLQSVKLEYCGVTASLSEGT